jgi:murein DD-endopeptidase MepM/ murein hydrolase activator NlpD
MRFAEFKLLEAVSDPEIVKIQEKLKQLGYDLGTYGPKGDGIDGVMGPFTQKAIEAYKKGIKPADVAADTSNTDTSVRPGPNPNIDDDTRRKAEKQVTGMPVPGPVTGPFGRIVQGPKGNMIPHPGVDMRAKEGDPISAPADGKIVYAAPAGSAGNLVELMTADGIKHRFMHLSKIGVQVGQSVKMGDTLGLVGNTGFSKGAHLHWEKIASNGKEINPVA